MNKLLATGLCLVVAIEVLALMMPDRGLVLALSGAALALVLAAVRWYLVRDVDTDNTEPDANDLEKLLQRWQARTESLISWSEASRRDWDRHLRPMLARQFEIATGQRRAKDVAQFHATGRILFGADLWKWVDPENVARTGGREPGPGRAALDEILRRLEQA